MNFNFFPSQPIYLNEYPNQNIEKLCSLSSNQRVTTKRQDYWDDQTKNSADGVILKGIWSTIKWGAITAIGLRILNGTSFSFGPFKTMCETLSHEIDKRDLVNLLDPEAVANAIFGKSTLTQCLESPISHRVLALFIDLMESFNRHPILITTIAIGAGIISYKMANDKAEQEAHNAKIMRNYTLYHDYHQMSKALIDGYEEACSTNNKEEKGRLEEVALKLQSQLDNIRNRFKQYTYLSADKVNGLISLLEEGINRVLAK